MTKGETRQYAGLMALVAEMYSINAGVAGMIAENDYRKANGDALAYPGKDFADAERDLAALAEKMREEI